MLQDTRRVEAYREALKNLCNGKIVADVGAGTGVLSIMAAEFGASCVYAIEFSAIIKECRRAVERRGVSKVVKPMQILAENAPLDPFSVDVLVSEWMGYFLLFERMLPSMLSVRDRHLK